MAGIVKRGYSPNDEKEFIKQIDKLRAAGQDLCYLINRGYPIKTASVFIGNHYLLSERQRLALVRSLTSDDALEQRKAREKNHIEPGSTVYIDTFNTIISLEIAFSGSTLLLCMDGAVRDLAGLRGTYRLIDKTDLAVSGIRDVLEKENVERVHFLLDAPVSNSGRLKEKIREVFQDSPVKAEYYVIKDVDRTLYDKENVVSSDGVILDHCQSWFNLARRVIDEKLGDYPYVKVFE